MEVQIITLPTEVNELAVKVSATTKRNAKRERDDTTKLAIE